MIGSSAIHKKVRYDLYRGHPNMQLLPQTEMKTIMSDILQAEDDSWRGYLNYGPNEGDERFRIALQTFLNRRTQDDDMGDVTNDGTSSSSDDKGDIINGDTSSFSSNEHELFITHGVSHGLELLCRTCTTPGDEVWIERPTYFLAPKIFECNNLIVKALPMMSDRKDNGGDIGQIDIDQLIHMVEEEGIPPPKMIYIIPSYHNPTGRSMTVNERERLAAFAIRHGVILVADEVYHLLDWEQKIDGEGDLDKITRRPAGIVHFNSNATKANDNEDRIGCCVSVSSFTKIWCPGFRLGWIDAPSFIIKRLKNYGYIDSQGGVAPFLGSMMTRAIKSNLLDEHLDKLKLEYSQRYELMCNILREEPQISILNDKSPISRQGGYFVWIGFPSSVNTDDFVAYSLEKYGIRFMAGKRCDPFLLTQEGDTSGSSIQSCARLCFADLDREDLVNATTTFVESFRSYMKSIE